MISKEQKAAIVTDFGGEKNSGSPAVQIAILTARINDLREHFTAHKKDFAGNRGLLKMIGKRKSLLKYVAKQDKNSYTDLIKKLGLRK